jgi:serine/threonine-protein kinase
MTMVEAVQRSGREPELAKYEIQEEIGRGGMATVYRAVDRRLGREVAVKVIHPHLRDSPEVASRFQTEAKAVAKLRHPNIVEVYDVSGPEEREQYLVSELVRGTTLRRLLQRAGVLPPEVAAAVAVELLDALAHAHASGVIHRDIKPENVLVDHESSANTEPAAEVEPADTPSGQIRRDRMGARPRRVAIKLTDFGIAKLLDAQGVTSTGQVLGSPAHMAPEQIEGGEVDARSDVFGMGVLLYECLVGHLPFEGGNPAQVLRRVLEGVYPPAVEERPLIGARWSALVDRALAHDRSARFATAGAMREALVAELERLGFWPCGEDLAAWIDDAGRYAERHATRVVERLRALAGEARRRGDALSAASDYNRALAHAPDDGALLRIVAHMHRDAAWTRAVRTAGAVVAGLLAIGAAGLVVARGVHSRASVHPAAVVAPQPPPVVQEPGGHAPSAVAVQPPIPAASSIAGAPSNASATDSAEGNHDPVLAPSAPRSPVAKISDRSVLLDVTPPMGVSVAVDGAGTRAVSTGDALTLDARAHTLTFTCPVCTSARVYVAAGEKGETVVVSVPIKPATLVVDGMVDSAYQLVEHPELAVGAGANSIPLKSARERATIKQMKTGATVTIRLEAGVTVHASFAR